MFINEDGTQPYKPEQTESQAKAELIHFLKRLFKKRFVGMIDRTDQVEQGIVILRDRSGKFIIREATQVDADSVNIPFSQSEINDATPRLIVHTHPYSAGYMNDIPSLSDLLASYVTDDYGNALDVIVGMVVCNSRRTAWVWQIRNRRELLAVTQAFHDWKEGITGPITYSDIEDFKMLLTNTGIRLVVKNLGQDNPTLEFISILEEADFV